MAGPWEKYQSSNEGPWSKYAAPEKIDATEGMSTTDKVLAGVGSGMSSAIRAVGGGNLLSKIGLPGTKEEADALNADLMNTTSGKVGSAVGLGAVAAPVALVPGANTYLGATLLGGVTGGALTEGGAAERIKGAGAGAAGGFVGKGLGDLVGYGASKLMSGRAASMAAKETANAQRDAAVTTAKNAGYVIPPADVKSSMTNELLNGISGKIKTAQVASARNQTVTNSLAKKALGIADDTPLNAQTLNAVRAEAGKAYQAVDNVGTITPGKAYSDALDKIVDPYVRASKSFPSAKPNPVIDEINTLRSASFDAGDAVAKIRTLRADADAAFAGGNKEVGKSLKAGADALEQAIDDHIAAGGPSAILKDFREARKLIAKTYTVQKGLNDTTGDVSAQMLAKQLEKGKPLSGDLKTIAQISAAFPKATQLLKETPKSISPLDWAMGAVTGASTGNPALVGMMAARPAARYLILSKPYQSLMTNNSYGPGLLDTMALPALQSEIAKRLAITSGMTGGLLAPANQ